MDISEDPEKEETQKYKTKIDILPIARARRNFFKKQIRQIKTTKPKHLTSSRSVRSVPGRLNKGSFC